MEMHSNLTVLLALYLFEMQETLKLSAVNAPMKNNMHVLLSLLRLTGLTQLWHQSTNSPVQPMISIML